jgi:hypothetical protein
MQANVDDARVTASTEDKHPTLFAVHEFAGPRSTPAEVCKKIGLNWFAAQKLHEEGWLSFDPQQVDRLTESQKAELTFLGSLVASGCDDRLLRQMLAGLEPPYTFHLDRMYYDWQSRSWQILRGDEDIRRAFDKWLDELSDSAQLARLQSLRDSVDRSILELRRSFANAAPW